LTAANGIYKEKDFEYFNIFDAVSAYKLGCVGRADEKAQSV
jgi:hypothetical protein